MFNSTLSDYPYTGARGEERYQATVFIGFCNESTANTPRPECMCPASFSPVPLRLNRPTEVEQIVGPIKRSGSGNRAGESGESLGRESRIWQSRIKEGLKNSDLPPAQECAGEINRPKRLIL